MRSDLTANYLELYDRKNRLQLRDSPERKILRELTVWAAQSANQERLQRERKARANRTGKKLRQSEREATSIISYAWIIYMRSRRDCEATCVIVVVLAQQFPQQRSPPSSLARRSVCQGRRGRRLMSPCLTLVLIFRPHSATCFIFHRVATYAILRFIARVCTRCTSISGYPLAFHGKIEFAYTGKSHALHTTRRDCSVPFVQKRY